MIKRLSVVIALGIALSLSACGNTDKAVNEPTEAKMMGDEEVMLRASRALLAFKADVHKDIFIEENVLEF